MLGPLRKTDITSLESARGTVIKPDPNFRTKTISISLSHMAMEDQFQFLLLLLFFLQRCNEKLI